MAVRSLREGGIAVSLFIDPEQDQLSAAARAGADFVELHTGTYAEARGHKAQQAELARLIQSATVGRELGLLINAGHGLDYRNVGPIAAIQEVEELSIGHSIIARAVLVGLERAVREMLAAMGVGAG
jgi:pyridoxine 5-phosphate synthase